MSALNEGGIHGDAIDTGKISMYAVTDPATNAATTSTIIGVYGGAIITTTTTGNSQTLASPTDTTAGKIFVIVNNDTSTNTIPVVANSVTYTIGIGVGQAFIWDGTKWMPTDLGITAIPVTVIQGGTGLSTITDHSVMVGSGTGAVTPIAVGTDNQILTGVTGADPIFKSTIDGVAIGGTTAGTIRSLFDEDTVITTGNLTANQVSGGVINNYAQSNDCAMTWPTIVEGQSCVFRCATTVAKYWRVVAPASMYIWLDGVKGSAAGYVGIDSATEGACFQIISVKNSGGTYDLMATTISGTIVAG